MLKTMNARTFWEQRVAEQMASSQEQITEMWQCRENSVWASIYGTIRDRRRSRSRTSSNSVPRSRTPSSVSSGRTTPSPGPYLHPLGRTMSEEVLTTSPDTPTRQICSQPHCKCKYHTKCWLVPRSIPVHYSSTIFIQLGSTKRRYLEEITFQKRLMPRKFSEGMEVATDPLCRCYTSEVTIPCQPHPNVINLEPQQKRDSHILTTVI